MSKPSGRRRMTTYAKLRAEKMAVFPGPEDDPLDQWSPDGTNLQLVYVHGKGKLRIAWCKTCKQWVVADYDQHGYPPGARALDVEGISDPWTYDAGGRVWTTALDKPPKPVLKGSASAELCWNPRLGLWQTLREYNLTYTGRVTVTPG